MKKSILAAAFLTMVSTGGVAQAGLLLPDSRSITADYAQSSIGDLQDIKGFNLKYRYELFDLVGIVASFSNMHSKTSLSDGNTDIKYYSLAAGPSLRINDYFSVYGLLGVNISRVSHSQASGMDKFYDDISNTRGGPMMGVGVQFNPLPFVVVDAAFEGASVRYAEERHTAKGFHIGVGIRF